VCTFNNPPPVHALSIELIGSGADADYSLQYHPVNAFFPAKYPADQPIGDGTGKVGLPSASNTTPWCIMATDDAAAQAWLTKRQSLDGKPLPICPPAAVALENRFSNPVDAMTGAPARGDMDDWATRGAINAGQAVFAYLDLMVSQGHGRDAHFDECELLGK
jgi:hypothetical protein